jgi:peptidoglycan/xylan/chitin deacetylase (PgdA/CDA1 family)
LHRHATLTPSGKMIFVTSWDDGHPLDAKVAELLERHGFSGTFFVPIRNREGIPVIGAAALRALSARHEIGSHTLDHAYLRGMPREVAQRQVYEGKAELENLLGHTVAGFCYPGGRYNAETVAIVRGAGFAFARSVENLVTDRPLDPFRVATTLQLYPHPRRVLTRNLLKYGRRLRKVELYRRLLRAEGLEAQLRLAAQYAAARDGVLHLWGHSWEIEKLGLWAMLERFFGWLAEQAPTSGTLGSLLAAAPRS